MEQRPRSDSPIAEIFCSRQRSGFRPLPAIFEETQHREHAKREVSKAIVRDEAGNILILIGQEPKRGRTFVDLPGGRKEPEDTDSKATLIREIMEEINRKEKPDNLHWLGTFEGKRYNHTWYGIVIDDPNRITLSSEHISYEWCSADVFLRKTANLMANLEGSKEATLRWLQNGA